MNKIRKTTKLAILLCGMTFLISINAYADHTHTDKCYGGTKHICNGNETTYGSCYSNKNVTYHTHAGNDNSSTPNGCYTKENITYHTHNDSCYKKENKNCDHTIDMGDSNGLKIMDYYNCPKCLNEDFYGYTYTLSCDNTNTTLYAGECENCDYKGNATITNTIIDNTPAKISYTHIVETISLNCEKTEQTIEQTIYTLNCGKTEQTIEQINYSKTCTKTNGTYYNSKGEKITPTCNQVVVSIKPKTEKQTTFNPDFTLVATYLDGHISEITPSLANYNKNKIYNNEKITLTYNGFIENAKNNNSLSTYIYLTTPITPTPTKEVTPTPTQVVTLAPTMTTTPTIAPTKEITPIITPTQKLTTIPTTIVTPTPIVESDINVDIDGSFVLETPTIIPNNNNNNNNNINTKEENEDIVKEQGNKKENSTLDLLGNIPSNNENTKEENIENNNNELLENKNDNNPTNIQENIKNSKKSNDKIIISIVIFVILLCFLCLLLLSIILLNKKEKNNNCGEFYQNVDNNEMVTNNEKQELDVIPPIINGSDNNYR